MAGDLTACGVCGKPAVQWTFEGTTGAAPQIPGIYTPQINGAYCAEHSPFRAILPNTLERLYAQDHAEVQRLRQQVSALLILTRAVASGEPLSEQLIWQAQGWIQAEDERQQEGGGDGG